MYNKKQKRIIIIMFCLLATTVLFYLGIVGDVLPIPETIFGGVLNEGSDDLDDTDNDKNKPNNPPIITNIDVKNVSYYVEDRNSKDTIRTSIDGKSLIFSLYLDLPEVKKIKFKVQNTGNRPIILGKMDTIQPDDLSGVTVVWPNLDSVVLNVNERSEEYTILVAWDGQGNGISKFNATLNYTEYYR